MVWFRQLFDLTPRRIAVGYGVFGVLWVLLSDRIVYAVVGTGSATLVVQTIKGWAFVGLSAGLIFGLTRVREEQLATSQRRAIAASQQIQVLHRLFRHNVRNDLTVIRGFARLIRERNTGVTVESWLTEIENTASDIIGMSEKLGIVNTVDIEPDRREPIDIVRVIENEVDAFRDRYPEATLRTTLPDRLFVEADWSIQYAIREAFQNAMAHHDAPETERTVEVRVTRTVRDVTIEIADDGPGIHPDEIEPIASGSESPLSHSSGVGLWIISWLVRSCDGSVAFDGGDGTTVRMTFEQADPIERVTERLHRKLGDVPGEWSTPSQT